MRRVALLVSVLVAGLLPLPTASAQAVARPAAAVAPHTVTYDEHSLLVDGKPLAIWGAEFHYFRLPSPDAWRDVLEKVKAGGFNAVSLYFNWSYHSPAPGVYDFTGVRDVDRLLRIAEELGLYVIARPGPYINAEVSGGGMPAWRSSRPGVNRTSEAGYMADAREWMSRINPIIARHQLTKGTGTVILYQIENEYQGGRQDADYMETLKTWAREDGIDVPTFLNDGGANKNWVRGKGAPDIYGFDAYPQGFDCANPSQWRDLPDYSYVNEWKPEVPLFIPEAQGGSFDGWGGTGYDDCAKLTGSEFTRVFTKMNFVAGASLQSFYMTFGGTNWGWLADPRAVYSSYDYGAPISETRMLREKYSEFKRMGYLFGAVPELARTDRAAAPTPTDPALRIDRRVNPDSGTQFFVIRHADTRVTTNNGTTLALSGRDGDYPRVPATGTIRIPGRDSKLLVAGYDLGGQRLVYSTAEIYTHARVGDRDVALMYCRSGESCEIALRYPSAPVVKVASGQAQSTWDAARGDLRVNFTGAARVHVEGAGRPPLDLVLGNVDDMSSWWKQETSAGPVLARGPYLVRSASVAGSTLALTGDTTAAGELEVIAPPAVKQVTWNGRVLTTRPNSLTAKLGAWAAPKPIQLPTLDSWAYADDAREAAPDFNDSAWTTADKLTAVDPTLAGSTPVLAADEYGFHHGDVWYRGRFAPSGRETAVALNAMTGPNGLVGAWLNGHYLGKGGDGRTQLAIPAGVLRTDGDNVLAVLVENMGHNEEWGHDYSKEPRGLISGTLIGGSTIVTWRVQGDRGGDAPVDTVRGAYNDGGRYGERAGWHLPGFPDAGWPRVSLPQADREPGLRWYRTTATLDLPAAQDTSVAVRMSTGGGSAFRAGIYVNGWLIGRYVPEVGPQHDFVIPAGLLKPKGENTIALAVWSTEAGSGPGPVWLVSPSSVVSPVHIAHVQTPAWNAKRYELPAPTAGLTVDAPAFWTPGQATPVTARFSVPAGRAGGRDVALALPLPDGWTATADGPTSYAIVRPGTTATARWLVTPKAGVPYAVLAVSASFTQGGTARTLRTPRAVAVPPPGPTGDTYVSDLELVRSSNGWGPVEKDKSNGENGAGDGRPLAVGGTTYAKGLGVHANSQIRVWLGGRCTALTATIGIDDEVGDNGDVTFSVAADDRVTYTSPRLTGASEAVPLSLDVTGVGWLDLAVDTNGDASMDHADWADAKLTCKP